MDNKEMNGLLLIGGGGHCKSVIDTLLGSGSYDRIGIVEKKGCAGNSVQGIEVVGCDDDLAGLYDEGFRDAFITLGSVGDTGIRRKLYDNLINNRFNIISIIDRSAIVSENASIEEGVFVGKGAIVNAGSVIKKCAIINTGAIVEHDCVIGDFSHVSSGAVLCGQVNIGSDVHVGAGSVVRQQIQIGDRCLIGAGSVIVKNIECDKKVYGNPGRVH